MLVKSEKTLFPGVRPPLALWSYPEQVCTVMQTRSLGIVGIPASHTSSDQYRNELQLYSSAIIELWTISSIVLRFAAAPSWRNVVPVTSQPCSCISRLLRPWWPLSVRLCCPVPDRKSRTEGHRKAASWQEGRPSHGWTVTAFRGRKVKRGVEIFCAAQFVCFTGTLVSNRRLEAVPGCSSHHLEGARQTHYTRPYSLFIRVLHVKYSVRACMHKFPRNKTVYEIWHAHSHRQH